MQPNKSSLKVDKNGKLRSANFTASEKTVYDFGEVPANSQVTFDEKKGWIINAPKDSEISEDVGFKDVKIIGENIKFPDGKTFSGELNYDSNGQAHIESGSNVLIDNVKIMANKDLAIYSDGQKHSGNYASFGDKFYFEGEGNPGEIIFEKGNDYFPNMKEGAVAKFSLGENYSSINIVKNIEHGYPNIYCKNQYGVKTGKLEFVSNGKNVYYKKAEGLENSVKMDIYTSVGEYDKLISIKEDSIYQAHVLKNGFLSPTTYNFYDSGPGSEITGNVLSGDLWNTYLGAGSYIREANEKYLQDTFAKKYKALDISPFKNVKDNLELDKLASGYSKYYVLTVKDVEDSLRGTKYENYFEKKEAFEISQAVSFSTSGTKESLGRGAVGIRTLFLKIA